MSKVKSKNTKIEVDFRKTIWKAGFRYRKNQERIFWKTRLGFKKRKIVIFIDSCFWHGCKSIVACLQQEKITGSPKLKEINKGIKKLINTTKIRLENI